MSQRALEVCSREPLAAGAVVISLSRGLFACVDEQDAAILLTHPWYALVNKVRDIVYAASTQCRDGRQRTVYMHREVLSAPSGILVDHIDGNGLNNRRSNIRLATYQQNRLNSRKRARAASQFKGVVRRRNCTTNPWEACIHGLGIGFFATEEDAAHAYDAAARERIGAFARLNFPLPGEISALVEADCELDAVRAVIAHATPPHTDMVVLSLEARQ